MGTTEQVAHVYDRAKDLMRSKEEVYEDSWRTEGIDGMVEDAFRKASGLKVMVKNGSFKKYHEKTLEDVLDLMNYGALLFQLVMEDGANEQES